MIEVKNVTHWYARNTPEEVKAVSGVSFNIEPGEFVAMLGHNGSGKSTLSRMLNALIFPHEGTIKIDGLDSCDEANIYDIRSKVGMVFQNPDSQIVCSTVEEEIAFGPGNLGISREEIYRRIDEVLKMVNMEKFRASVPSKLSGGQKQKIAIASVLAMKPAYIILDEPTSMLDPYGRRQVLDALSFLNKSIGIAVILVTQHMQEAFEAGRIIVMHRGKLVYDGAPEKLFSDGKKLESLSLGMPASGLISESLRRKGVKIGGLYPKLEKLAEKIADLYNKGGAK